ALRRARSTAGAFRRVHKTRLLPDTDREIARLPFDAFHLAQGEKFDVLVPADLDQTRRHGAHRAIVGGKGLVELPHPPADGGAAFGQIHLDAAFGEIERGLHTANTASHYQRGANRTGLCQFRRHGRWPPRRALAARPAPLPPGSTKPEVDRSGSPSCRTASLPPAS